MSNSEKILDILKNYRFRLFTISDSFYLKGNIPEKKLKNAIKAYASGVSPESVLALYDSTVIGSGKSGILFTDTKVCYVEIFDKPSKFWYDDISSVEVIRKARAKKDCDHELLIQRINEPSLKMLDVGINKTPFCELLQKIVGVVTVKEAPLDAQIDFDQIKENGAFAGGYAAGNYGTANKLYNEEKFHARQGHGFAAEQANNFYDKMHGRDAKVVGDNNVKNGPDRVVDGVFLQSKYCRTGEECIKACFDDEGKFRYWNSDGKPMQIEVPRDKYDAALREMENKIRNGEVEGITDPKQAKDIVREGHYTYEQVKNIAKAGTIDSLKYDAQTGAIIATTAFGVTAIVSLATNLWNGEDFNTSLKIAAFSGLKVGGTAFVTTVITSQLSKAGLNSALVGSSEAIMWALGPKASAVLINAFRNGSNIYGAAAMRSAAKLLRGNTITAGVTILVLTSVDITNIFRGRISGKQLFKNMANTTATVAGGTGGWLGGAAIGSAIAPGIGTVIGGLVGSLTAGSVTGGVTNKVTSKFIEDDAEEMVAIIQKRFELLAKEYLLNQKEAEKTVDQLGIKLKGSTLKDMFASNNRAIYANNLLIPIIESEIKKRRHIRDISADEFIFGFKAALEEIADSENS